MHFYNSVHPKLILVVAVDRCLLIAKLSVCSHTSGGARIDNLRKLTKNNVIKGFYGYNLLQKCNVTSYATCTICGYARMDIIESTREGRWSSLLATVNLHLAKYICPHPLVEFCIWPDCSQIDSFRVTECDSTSWEQGFCVVFSAQLIVEKAYTILLYLEELNRSYCTESHAKILLLRKSVFIRPFKHRSYILLEYQPSNCKIGYFTGKVL